MRAGVIGPTNMGMQAQFTGLSMPFLEQRAALVGQILAEMRKELWVNADGGMLEAVAKSYKEHGGPKLVMLLPSDRSDDWPVHAKAREVAQLGDEVRRPFNWAATNREVVTLPELVVCVGLSMGTQGELAYASIRWNLQFMEENPETRPLIAIRELLRGKRFPPEYEFVLARAIQYVDTVEELRPVLGKFQEEEVVEPMPS